MTQNDIVKYRDRPVNTKSAMAFVPPQDLPETERSAIVDATIAAKAVRDAA